MTQYPIDWDEDVIRRYLTPESHQKSKEEFERTHIDIDKIKSEYLFPHPSNDEFVTQEEFRDAIVKSNIRDDNRIFILRGETGSGKSQLCQWLEYQIGTNPDVGVDETHVALHVSRSQSRIEDIIEILTEPIDIDIQVGNVEALDPEKVADAMTTNLDAYAPAAFPELSSSEIESLIQDRSGTDLRTILERNIKSYQEAVASDGEQEIPDLLDEEDYRDLAISAFGQARGGQTIFPTLLGFLHDDLSGNLNVGNFQEKLERISEEYVEQGLRPVLICEDLTTFSVLKEQLLDHIFQLDSGHYDVVLGWTTGWEKDSLDKALGTTENTFTYMKDRAEGYLSTTDEEGQAYFLTEDVTVELARRYLTVIREESETEPAVTIPEEAFDRLYPFNAEFIQHAYEHLVQEGTERRTPRLLLIRIVRECLTGNVPPFDAMDGNPYVKQFPTPVSIDLPTDVQNIAKWYGIPTVDGDLEVPRGIFETFDVSVPSEMGDDDPVVFDSSGPIERPDLRLDLIDGIIEPGAVITVETTVNSRPEADVDVEVNDDPVGFTGDDGRFQVELPNEETEVTITARKANLSASEKFSVGTDSLHLSTEPSRPEEGKEVTVTAKLNGEPTEGVEIFKDNESVGTTDADGSLSFTADQSPELPIRGEIDGIEDERTIQVEAGGTYPVEVDLPPDEVDQRRYEYEQWLKAGAEYDSSTTLRDGAVTVLEMWHDPTRLANANASTTGTTGIYYARGSETPVSIQAVDERQGLSIELPFGTEYNNTYEPLLWCGLSEDNSLPREGQYQLNYDLLRGWADEQVQSFRAEMRTEIENQLPEDWTIEEFVIVAQFLLTNAGKGETEVSREMAFEEFSTANGYSPPIRERFAPGHPFREAFNNLTKSSSVPADMAEGLFKLKENFVDNDRLEPAYESVSEDLDTYLTQAMLIDDELPDAYRLGTTRSNATTRLEPVLTRVKEYAQELESLGADDVEHITERVESVDQWFDEDQTVPQLRELYEKLYDAAGTLDINIKDSWERQLHRLEDGDDIHLGEFRRDIEDFREVESKTGAELVAVLHQFEKSAGEDSEHRRAEWEIYEAIDDMITQCRAVEVPESSVELEEAVHETDVMKELRSKRTAIEDTIGGDGE